MNAVYQFYPLSRLWSDIELCMKHELTLAHLTAEPIQVKRIVELIFPSLLASLSGNKNSVIYDFRTIYGRLFDGSDHYQCFEHESLAAIDLYKLHCHKALVP